MLTASGGGSAWALRLVESRRPSPAPTLGRPPARARGRFIGQSYLSSRRAASGVNRGASFSVAPAARRQAPAGSAEVLDSIARGRELEDQRLRPRPCPCENRRRPPPPRAGAVRPPRSARPTVGVACFRRDRDLFLERGRATWTSGGDATISSSRASPGRRGARPPVLPVAPENAPFTFRKLALGSARAEIGAVDRPRPGPRRPKAGIARATTSLPVPVSTDDGHGAAANCLES